MTLANKPNLSIIRILMMSVGFFGIQHGFAIQFAKMTAIYEQLGADASDVPYLWIAAPLTGFIIQPIIGYMSDRTWCKLGRRRPYFLVGAILATIAMFVMPNSTSIMMAAMLLWMLDLSLNISMEPFRAFVADMLPDNQVPTGYAMQTLMIGIGGFLGNWISSMDWLTIAPVLSDFAKTNLQLQFYICGLIYIAAVLFTVCTCKEYPPENIESFRKHNSETGGIGNWASHTWSCLKNMPSVMKRLAWVQFFTWMGLFCMWMFYSVAVAKHVFHASDVHSKLFEEGVGAAAQAMGFYNIISTVFALLMPIFAYRLGRVNLHFVGLLLAGLGLLSVWIAESSTMLYVGMFGVGIGWACVLALPYAIIATYIPQENYGIYMGIFNIFIVLPEVITTLVLGYVMSHWLGNSEIAVVTLGGVFMVIAALLTFTLRKFQYDKK